MNRPGLLLTGLSALLLFGAMETFSQEKAAKPDFQVGVDVFTNYIWRGTKLGQGPALQPSVKMVAGGLTIGVWGSFDASGYVETDPYISYALPFGLSLGLTDYYYPNLPLFEVSDTAGSHALEINVGFVKSGLSLSANYIVNEAGGAASKGSDWYFQAGYAFKIFNISMGAGDGWHTTDGNFAICHIAIGAAKVIKITDTFSIPVSGQVIVNPEREALYVVVGFSL